MTLSAEVIDNLIAATLLQRGRVCADDLVGVDEAERAGALAAYVERHPDVSPSLRFEGGDLVAGAPEPAAATSLEDEPLSDVDLLLEGYEGGEEPDRPALEPSGASAQVTAPTSSPAAASPQSALSAPGRSSAGPGAGATEPGGGQPRSHLWLLWWIPVAFIPLLGGVAAWYVLRHKRVQIARVMLGVGIGVGMLGSVLFLRYAKDIAGFVSGASRGTVITLPSGSASSQPAD